MAYDELELDRIGDRKTAVFFIISDTTQTYNFLVALAFSQMFNLLCERADNVHGGRLPHHVRVLWDEAANTGQVPQLEKLVAVIRSREVSLCLLYQQLAQCKAIYDKHAETILGNMDSVVFLGGREASTIKEISENWLGKATISMQTDSRSRGQSESYSQNTQRLGRELMTPAELATMPGDKCILQLRGLPPFFSPKYDLKRHPNYRYTAEADKQKNAFDLDRLINRRRRPGLNEACTMYEVAVPDDALTEEDEDILNYRAMVDEAYAAAERQKARVDPMYHDKIDALVDRYARKLAENLNERNVIDARVPSILISGGGNFPVAKKHKQNAARDRNYGEYAEISKLLDKIRSVGMGGISADDDLAVEKLTKKLEGLESLQATMKAVNAYFRKHKTLDGCPELTPEQAEKLKADMAQSWHLDKSKPYPAYLLSNNNANIRRVRQRIEELSSRSEFAGWTFSGGEAKINEAENRLQLIFEEKPDADQRQELKSNGFKWAPSQGAWQRQLNQNAIRAAARIDFLRPEDGTSPYQLQPFVKRENKEMSR